MKNKVRLINIEKEILSENKNLAHAIRTKLTGQKTFMLNIMGSPGCGKTSFIIETIKQLKDIFSIAVLEADVDSAVDADKIVECGGEAIQIRTGGFCHLTAAMVEKGLDEIGARQWDLILVENIGNLICPAASDIGAHKNIVILSVPEGDDKPLKYPLIFRISDFLIVNKIDYMGLSDFDQQKLIERACMFNPEIRVFPLSCRTGEGIDQWSKILTSIVGNFKKA